MRVQGWAAAVLFLASASSAVALDPGEWTGTSDVRVRSFRQGVTRGGDRIGWSDSDQAVLAVDTAGWSLTGDLTGGLSGTATPLGGTLHRARAGGDGFLDWASRIVSPASMLGEGSNDIWVRGGSLRGVLRVTGDGSDARLDLRGRWRGTVMYGPEVGRTRSGTIRVLVHGLAE